MCLILVKRGETRLKIQAIPMKITLQEHSEYWTLLL